MIILLQMTGQETTKLWDYLPRNPYDWQWRTCSDDHIAPAQKPNLSVTCISLSTRSPDQQSYPLVKYNCAPHTYPFRLLSPKPQTYPSVSMSKINNEITVCLYIQLTVTKLPVYPHKQFLAILHVSLQTCRHSYASPYPQMFYMINTPVVSSQLSTYISTKVIVCLD